MRILEIAVFEATDPEGFTEKQARLHTQLPDLFEGHVSSIGLRSDTEPAVFADLVLWRSLADAEAAAAAMGDTEALSWFRAELGPVRFFDHFQPTTGGADLMKAASAATIELVLVRPADVDAFASAHTELHQRHLDEARSVVSHVQLAPNANGVVGDVNGWTSADAMAAMGATMMERAELAPVFDPENEMLLFMPFTINVAP